MIQKPAMSAMPAKDKLLDEFNTVVAETEHLLKSVASLGDPMAGVLKGNVDLALASASDRVTDIRDRSLAQAEAAMKATDEYVRHNPWHAIGIVAAVTAVVGLASGLMIARR